MSYLIAELFERHDRTRFEVFGYCTSPEDGSAIRPASSPPSTISPASAT